MNVEKRQEIERKVVRHLVRAMNNAGWNPTRIDDGGDELIKPINGRMLSEGEVMDSVFAVDEAQILFTSEHYHKSYWVMIVLGNDGWDCISDYAYGENDDFEKVMKEQVDTYTEKLELECS